MSSKQEYLIKIFLKGLREVREEIKLHPIKAPSDLMDVVQSIDDKRKRILKLRVEEDCLEKIDRKTRKKEEPQ